MEIINRERRIIFIKPFFVICVICGLSAQKKGDAASDVSLEAYQCELLFSVVWRNDQFLSNLNLIGIVQLVAVGIEDSHVLVRVSVELLADLR